MRQQDSSKISRPGTFGEPSGKEYMPSSVAAVPIDFKRSRKDVFSCVASDALLLRSDQGWRERQQSCSPDREQPCQLQDTDSMPSVDKERREMPKTKVEFRMQKRR